MAKEEELDARVRSDGRRDIHGRPSVWRIVIQWEMYCRAIMGEWSICVGRRLAGSGE
jgi:hypothetical protein